jgi:hypothetical protein
MLSLSIVTEMKEPKGARYLVKIEPPVRVKPGVYFETNEHYPAPESEGLKALVEILGAQWQEIIGPGPGECIVLHLGDNEWCIVDSCLPHGSSEPAAVEYLKSLGNNTLAGGNEPPRDSVVEKTMRRGSLSRSQTPTL